MSRNSYHPKYQLSASLEPWRSTLGDQFDAVVATLTEREFDLFDQLGTGRWIPYTPTVTCLSGTNPSFGASPLMLGGYTRFGRTVHGFITIAAGVGAAPGSAPTEAWDFSLPTARENPYTPGSLAPLSIGSGCVIDSSAGALWTVNTVTFLSSNIANCRALITGPAGATFMSNSNPFALASGDSFALNFTYDGASQI